MGERSRNIDTKSPVTPKSTPQGKPSGGPEDLSRYNQPLVVRSKFTAQICPQQSKLALQLSVTGTGTKAIGPEGQAPRQVRSCLKERPCPPPSPDSQRMRSFVPYRLLSGWGSEQRGQPGGNFRAVLAAFPGEKGCRGVRVSGWLWVRARQASYCCRAKVLGQQKGQP